MYYDRSLKALVEALDPAKQQFVHVGNLAGMEPDVLELPAVVAHPPMPYDQAVETIANGHIGVVFLSEASSEAPARLYDYVGLGLELLICTNGPIPEGPIAKLFTGVGGVHWCRDRPEDLRQFVQNYIPGAGIPSESRQAFSRRAGLERLVELIKQLTHPNY